MNEFANEIFHADARHLLAKLPNESIDAVICDPMYGGFDLHGESRRNKAGRSDAIGDDGYRISLFAT